MARLFVATLDLKQAKPQGLFAVGRGRTPTAPRRGWLVRLGPGLVSFGLAFAPLGAVALC